MLQFSEAVRNARLDAVEDTIGASPVLEIRSGAAPANCAAADTGTVLATLNLPADWMNDAASGAKTLLGTWQDLSADATGVAGHYRIKANGGTPCHAQGDVTATSGGGSIEVNNVNFAAGQPFSIDAWTLTEGNA